MDAAPDVTVPKRDRRSLALVLSILAFTLAVLFFVRSGDAMILIFGIIASAILFVVVRGGFAWAPAQSVKLRCPTCGRLNAEDARYCDACGRAL